MVSDVFLKDENNRNCTHLTWYTTEITLISFEISAARLMKNLQKYFEENDNKNRKNIIFVWARQMNKTIIITAPYGFIYAKIV